MNCIKDIYDKLAKNNSLTAKYYDKEDAIEIIYNDMKIIIDDSLMQILMSKKEINHYHVDNYDFNRIYDLIIKNIKDHDSIKRKQKYKNIINIIIFAIMFLILFTCIYLGLSL